MLDVIQTLLFEHDLKLVALAALICALSAFSAITLFTHARKSGSGMRKIWLAIAAVATGSGIWATHFIAMLAFNPGMALGYDFMVNLSSLGIAITVTGGGLWFAAIGTRRSDSWLGGAVVGLGISAMHYTGMAAVLIGGEISWRPELVALSILYGLIFGALAIGLSARSDRFAAKLQGTLLLTLAICLMHFTAMGAAGFENCFAVVSPSNSITAVLMPTAIAGGSLFILVAALVGVYLEVRERRREQLEAARMSELANAAVEGLVVCEDDRIITVNNSFLQLIGQSDPGLVINRPVSDFIPASALTELREQPERSTETEVGAGEENSVPVEAILRNVDYAGHPRQVIAFRDLRDRREAEQYIRYLAHHDALTGLPNRTSFSEQLEREMNAARRYGRRMAVICLDLDRFKQVNDLFGHAAGDQLLKQVATCMNEALEPDQYGARLSGDEFAIIVPDIDMPSKAGGVAQKLLDSFSRQNTTAGEVSHLSASIGIAIYPENADTAAALMSHADTALYRAKQDGRGSYSYFQDEMGAQMRERRLLEHELRLALDKDQLRLVYQPQVEIEGGRIVGFEALLRWRHSERGDIPPSQFIPLAEESGLILQIGEWVLKMGCAEAATWKNPLSVAVNVSAVQLHNHNFAERLHEILRETGLSPTRLEIEITETALIKDMPRALATLAKVKALGVHIAMDDFGTGYSSLSNLRAFNFDKIKVDQSFIRSVDSSEQSAAIVRAVLGLGRGLNLPVLAEGVERFEELEFLRDETCAQVQGFLIRRPMEVDAIGEFTSSADAARWDMASPSVSPKASPQTKLSAVSAMARAVGS
jgi:diguanylate cyclase (GGDEF)-like protein